MIFRALILYTVVKRFEITVMYISCFRYFSVSGLVDAAALLVPPFGARK